MRNRGRQRARFEPRILPIMKKTLFVAFLVFLALLLPFFLPAPGRHPGADPERNLPWQIETDGRGGSTVFGLRPGESSLVDARAQLGTEMEVAIIAAPGETGSLEAYAEQVPLGFVLGRVIVTVDMPPETIAAMRERAIKSKHMESTTRKITLRPDDLAAAERAPIRAISVIPTVNLDEATVIQRFGQPEERLAVSEKRVHLLYPSKGVDVVLDSDGKELLQYVAPRDFASLREPLRAELAEGKAPAGEGK